MNLGKGFFLSFLFIFTSSANAFLSHEQIVDRFKTKNFNLNNSNSVMMETLDVNQVIGDKLQKNQIQYNQKSNLVFNDVKHHTDLRHRDSTVVRQLGPRCSAYGLVAGIENLLGLGDDVKLSQSHLFANYRKYSSERAVYTAKRMAITEYKYWPHERKWVPKRGYKANAHTKLTDISFINNDVAKAVRALDQGRPVYLGMSVTRSMGKCDAIMDPASPTTGGGHAINISGYGLDDSVPGGGYFIIKNSWGKNCGDKGYQYMPFNYCMNGGSQYCIMWDIQGVRTKFAGVSDVKPKEVVFDVNEINIDVSKKNKLHSKTRKYFVKFWGDSRHIKQVERILVTFKSNGKTYKFLPQIDEFKFKFESQRAFQDITVYYKVKGGDWFIKDYQI